MSATTMTQNPAPQGAPRSLLPAPIEGPTPTQIPFGRLVGVELRKLTDTRSGKWLLIIIAAIVAIGMGAMLFAGEPGSDKDFKNFVSVALIPLGILLPILGILAATSEWSQRTGLVTFSLEPRRGRVGWAKFAAAEILAVGLVLVGLAIAALGTVLAQVIRGADPSWSVGAPMMVGGFIGLLLPVAMGVGLGLLLQNTPGAIVFYFALPTVLSMLTLVSWLQKPMEWLDMNHTIQPFYAERWPAGQEIGQFIVSNVVWVLIPLILGFVRLRRSEIK